MEASKKWMDTEGEPLSSVPLSSTSIEKETRIELSAEEGCVSLVTNGRPFRNAISERRRGGGEKEGENALVGGGGGGVARLEPLGQAGLTSSAVTDPFNLSSFTRTALTTTAAYVPRPLTALLFPARVENALSRSPIKW